LPARWSRDERDGAILAGLLRREEVEMPFESPVCHQISTHEEAQTLFDYIETGNRARLDFPMVGLSCLWQAYRWRLKFMPVLRAKAPPPQGSTLAAPPSAYYGGWRCRTSRAELVDWQKEFQRHD
jgi:hypothetical protein